MSTRANVILREPYSKDINRGKRIDELMFYRHSDGYPAGVLPTLEKLSDWIKRGVVRNNLMQVAGWLVILGAMEYNAIPEFEAQNGYCINTDTIKDPEDWKVGAYEPCTGLVGNIEYVYVMDITTGEITYRHI